MENDCKKREVGAGNNSWKWKWESQKEENWTVKRERK
jgi:hypothetical protein